MRLKIKSKSEVNKPVDVFDFSHNIDANQFLDEHPNLIVEGCVVSNCGRHAGGVLILDEPERNMPVIRIRDHVQSPWVEGLHQKTLEVNGFVKIDLLGLDTLRIFQRCIEKILQKELSRQPMFDEVQAWYTENMHPDRLDLEDQHVYEHVYHNGKFPSVFQFVSHGAQALIQKFKPRSVVDIAAATSIYRPGPLNAHVDKLYLEAKENPESVHYEHPLVKKVLEKTYGCAIFQEEIMELAHVVGGFTLEESDKVRKALMKRTMSNKDAAAIKQKELGDKFVAGAVKNGLTESDAQKIWEKMKFFSGYGFCVSGDTLVETQERGSVQIKNIKIGENVNSENGFVKVVSVFEQGEKFVYELRTESNLTLKCTEDHKIMTPTGLVALRDLIPRVNREIVTKSGITAVVEVIGCGYEQTYDITVDHPAHTFFANDISISNCYGHALAYAIDSYQCAWLFTYHPDEWLCAWLESAQGDPDEKSKAIAEVKRYGYKIVPLDINIADDTWTILPGKKFMPSFKSLSGVGDVALEEIKRHRPYKDITDLLWNSDGTWRHSKANKKVWDVLTKLGCMDSMGLVGEGKMFANYRQLNYVLVDGAIILKKKNGIQNLRGVLSTALTLEDWSDQEKAQFSKDLAGNLDANKLISEDVQEKLKTYGVQDMSLLTEGKGLVWFILEKFIPKKTKNGKDYLLLTVTDSTGQSNKVFLWNGRQNSYIQENGVYLAEVSKSDFGYSCSMRDLKKLD